MSLADVQALTFDTGGTVLDWHRGFKEAFHRVGKRHGIERDWSFLTNELRRRSMQRMLNAGEQHPPSQNMDGVHREVLDALLDEAGLGCFSDADRHHIAYDAPHAFECWTGFDEMLEALRANFMVASFSILSYRMILDTAKHNRLNWDAVFSCEGLGKYKLLPQTYLMVAEYLQLQPEQCCMVACHEYDLDAARAVGFKTAYLHRPEEWGSDSPPSLPTAPDIVAESHAQLLDALTIGQ
ncbi:hypothetical protein LCL99_11130 [Halomonas denitrificans]|uniref:HAD family hydrolase n=1 Tax=Halomonas denitrificans TaxID=370769 RepID=UPI001CD3CCAF|nr:HAD family hydrolase [Halomonas denitrificans]MCA0975024.1 hypothetical protein [Halomonas denitrificans]